MLENPKGLFDLQWDPERANLTCAKRRLNLAEGLIFLQIRGIALRMQLVLQSVNLELFLPPMWSLLKV